MADRAHERAAGPGRATQDRPGSDSGRGTARTVLADALRGMELTATDRRFLTRLAQWDKRTATSVASLIARARECGREETRQRTLP